MGSMVCIVGRVGHSVVFGGKSLLLDQSSFYYGERRYELKKPMGTSTL